MSLEEIFADVSKEGDTDPFRDISDRIEGSKEKETPAESQPEKEPETVKPEEGINTPDEENLPFHKHPRWIERENELKELREFKEQAAPRLSEIEQHVKSQTIEKSDIPEWFQELYGDNQKAWEKYAEHSKQEREQMKRELVADQQRQQEEAKQEEQKWEKWVSEGVKNVGEKHKVDLISNNDKDANGNPTNFLRNELIQTMLTYRPSDDNNNFDFEKGYQILVATKGIEKPDPARSQARKQLADTTTKSSKSEKNSKDYMTPSDLRGKSWNQL